MKVVKKFRRGEPVPFSAKYLRTETRRENFRWVDCDCHTLLNCNCHEVDIVEYDVYEVEIGGTNE